jgi:TonB family protein
MTMTTQSLAPRRLAQALGLALTALTLPVQAQGVPAAGPGAASAPIELSVSDRVKKDAAGPLYWIRLNAQKADAASTAKPVPRITELRGEARAPRPAAAQPVPAREVTARAGATVRAASAPAAAPGLADAAPGVAADSSAAAAPGAALAGTSAAGLAAPAGSSATDAARTAAAEPPADEPDDQPLAVLQAEEPNFPANVMRKLRKGTVQVRFEVQADGSVADVAVVQTTHRSLNNAAIEAVNAWRFEPVRTPRSAIVDLGFDLDG